VITIPCSILLVIASNILWPSEPTVWSEILYKFRVSKRGNFFLFLKSITVYKKVQDEPRFFFYIWLQRDSKDHHHMGCSDFSFMIATISTTMFMNRAYSSYVNVSLLNAPLS